MNKDDSGVNVHGGGVNKPSQLVFDWDKLGRESRRHYLAQQIGLLLEAPGDQKLLLCCYDFGRYETDLEGARSVLKATIREVCGLSGLSAGGVHKAKRRLTGRRPPLMRYRRGEFTASWTRVWGCSPSEPDLLTAVNVHACSRTTKKEERSITNPNPKSFTNQELRELQELERALLRRRAAAAALADRAVASAVPNAETFRDAADLDDACRRIHAGQVRGLVAEMMRTVRAVEATHPPSEAKVFLERTAVMIAEGILGSPDGSPAADELRSILASMRKVAEFTSSPGGYLYSAASERGWVSRRPDAFPDGEEHQRE